MLVSSIHDDNAAHLCDLWSAVIGDLHLAWTATNVRFASGPAEVSPASRDDAALARVRPEWDRHEGTGAGIDAVQMIDAAAQHLLGLKALLDSRTLALAPWPLARAVAEHVAHVAWLLEPGIRPEARMVRRWMARLAAAHRYRWMVGARKASKAHERDAKECRESIRDQLLRRFPGADTEWSDPAELPPWTIAAETYPSLSQQSRLIEKLGVESVAGLYNTLSLITHPNPVTLTMLVDKNDVDDHVEVIYRVEPEQWTSIVGDACKLLYAAAHAACVYFALDTDHLEAWYDRYESARH